MSKLIHEEIDKEISGKSVNIAVRMLKPELDQFMRGLNKAVQAPAKTAGKAVVNKIHPTAGRQSIKTLIKQGQGVSSIPLADEGLRDFQKIAKKYGVDFAVVRDREKSPPVYTVFFKASFIIRFRQEGQGGIYFHSNKPPDFDRSKVNLENEPFSRKGLLKFAFL